MLNKCPRNPNACVSIYLWNTKLQSYVDHAAGYCDDWPHVDWLFDKWRSGCAVQELTLDRRFKDSSQRRSPRRVSSHDVLLSPVQTPWRLADGNFLPSSFNGSTIRKLASCGLVMYNLFFAQFFVAFMIVQFIFFMLPINLSGVFFFRAGCCFERNREDLWSPIRVLFLLLDADRNGT